jgi:hypothetical protein
MLRFSFFDSPPGLERFKVSAPDAACAVKLLPKKESKAQHKQTAVDSGISVVNTRVRNMMKAPLSGQRCPLAYEIVKTHA